MARGSNRAYSRVGPVAKVSALASLLSVSETDLREMSSNVPELRLPGKVLTKKDGTPRPTHDAHPPLKRVHEQIKNRLLKQVFYPPYLLGGIADPVTTRDYARHAAVHAGRAVVVSEDIKNFFPSVTTEVVHGIWQRFFNFHPDVAFLLTQLTTYDGMLPQGWKTSGYLANLALWDREPDFVEQVGALGLAYTRFMDDVAVSSPVPLNNEQLQKIVSGIYGMLAARGFAPKRAKHKIETGRSRMEVTGLNVNAATPSMPRQRRDQIRAQVFQCERAYRFDAKSEEYQARWRSASGNVGTMKRFNPGEAKKLRARLNAIRPR